MGKVGKRYKALKQKVDATKLYDLQAACELAVSNANAKFDETIDVSVRLGVDPRKADQNIRGSVALPHGLGKTVRVAVFAKGDKAKEAQEAGADIVGSDELVKMVQDGNMDFDTVVATPDMMGQVGKVGKLLGPRGLMPSPKVGTVTFEVGEVIRSLKAGRAEYRVDKAGIIHAAVGKASFGAQKIKENAETLLQALLKVKPSSSKGIYMRTGSISSTMGPGVSIDLSPMRSV
jgi:large subunit ribosomal protein L1